MHHAQPSTSQIVQIAKLTYVDMLWIIISISMILPNHLDTLDTVGLKDLIVIRFGEVYLYFEIMML